MKNKKGVVLILAIGTMAMISVISAALSFRAINANRITLRNNDSLQAFYEAESGISYVYAEISRGNFNWYTHEDKNTRIAVAHTVTNGSAISFNVPVTQLPSAYIDGSGYYRIPGRNFFVKADELR